MMFMVSVMVGIMISLSSMSVLSVWVGMEVGFLGVIGVMSGQSVGEVESTMKYFIVQVLGSLCFLLGVMVGCGGVFLGMELVLLVVGLCFKVGLFPFHFWVPAVMSQMSWWGCMLVGVFQKVVPLWVFSNIGLDGYLLGGVELVVMMTALLGCLGGLGVLHFRVLFAFSSLIHTGFMVVLSMVSLFGFFSYLLVYFFLNLGLVLCMWSSSIYSVLDVLKVRGVSVEVLVLSVSLYALSLAGLPPFSGCFLKVYFLGLCWGAFPLVCLVLVFSSGVSLYFYLSMFLSLSMMSGSKGLGIGGSVNILKSWYFLSSLVLNLLGGLPLFMSVGIY
uniref:NADH-ubiquinone oxidoreductase chain 2 n=1 Tax=Lutraria maxima TaxID=971267 RepID=A0A343S4N0_9BIVA|nr:NADH dehydrogenase subunit 2 [Lutraria maxima]AUH21196.1 NADH dehydrogenase subunit 2 [Lutraria maxima]